jgi:hypothetical protein
VSMVGRNMLGLQPVGDGLIKDKCYLCIMHNLFRCVYLSLRCIFMCMLAGYLLRMARCSFLGWFSTNLAYYM